MKFPAVLVIAASGLLACAGQGAPQDGDGAGGKPVAGASGAGAGGMPAAGAVGGSMAGSRGGTGGLPSAGSAAGSGGSASGAGGAATGGSGGVPAGGSGGLAPGGSGGLPAAGTGGAPAGGCTDARATFCADFEGDAIPASAVFFPEYQRANVAKFVQIDPTVARGGKKSLKVSGTEFSQMLGVPVPGTKFWVRFHLRSDTDIQQGHNTYVAAVEGNGDPNVGQAIRIGEHQCQLELNRRSDDKELLSNGGMYMCGGGVKLLANQWACIEALFDGPAGEVRVFVDGTEIDKLHATGWGPYDYKLFKFGYEKYHGANKTLWFDDVAVGPERIGCAK